MTENEEYYCEECGKVWENSVLCCGFRTIQKPLEKCLKPPASAETARTNDADDACDDGR